MRKKIVNIVFIFTFLFLIGCVGTNNSQRIDIEQENYDTISKPMPRLENKEKDNLESERSENKDKESIQKQQIEKAQEYYDLGRIAEYEKDIDKAINLYKKAIEFYSDFLQAHIALAEIYMINKDDKSVIEEYEYIIKIDPDHPFIKKYKEDKLKFYGAQNIAQNGDYEKALSLLREISSDTPLKSDIMQAQEEWIFKLKEKKNSETERIIKLAKDLASTGKFLKAIDTIETVPDYFKNKEVVELIKKWQDMEIKKTKISVLGKEKPPKIPSSKPIIKSFKKILPPLIDPSKNTLSKEKKNYRKKLEKRIYRYINASRVNIRQYPSLEAPVITFFEKDTKVELVSTNKIIEDNYNWVKIKLSSGKIGWVTTNFLSLKPSNSSKKYAYINGNEVNMRKYASTSSEILKVLSKNDKIILLPNKAISGDGTSWSNIKLLDGKSGWIVSRFISTKGIDPQSERIIKLVNGDDVNIRTGASLSSNILSKVSKNTRLILVSSKIIINNGLKWLKVRLPDGKIGFIADIYLK